MSEGWSSAQRLNRTLSKRHQLEVTPMFKKILLSAAALSGLVLFASQADAHYGYGGYGYGYGHPHYSYSYYQPHCYTATRPVTIRVWSDYAYGYIFRTVYRDYTICN
jgi:hypothetical protein